MIEVSDLLAKVIKAAKEANVPEDMARHAFKKENFGGDEIPTSGQVDTDRVSPKQAKGVMQVIPATFQGLIKNGVLKPDSDPNDLDTNIKAGMAVLAERYKARGGNKLAALADYNGGIAAGDAVMAGKEPPAEETRRYITGFNGAPKAMTTSSTSTPAQRGSTSVTYKDIDPVEATDNLKKYVKDSNDLIQQMWTAIDSGAATAEQGSQAALAKGNAMATVYKEKGAIEAEQERTRGEIQAVTPGAGHGPDSRYVRDMIAVEQLRNKQESLRKEIDAQDQVTIFDDPLQWMINQVYLPKQKMAYNSTVMEAQQRLAHAKETQDAIHAQTLVDMHSVEANIKSRASAEAAAAQAEAAMQSINYMQKSQAEVIAGLHTQLSVTGATYSQTAALASKLADTYRFNSSDAAQSKQDQATNETLKVLNFQRQAYGLTPITIDVFKQLAPGRRSELMEQALKPTFSSPGDAFQWMSKEGALNTVGNTKPVLAAFMAQEKGSLEQKRAEEQYRASLTPSRLAAITPEEVTAHAWDQRVADDMKKIAAAHYDTHNLPEGHWYKVNVTSAAATMPALKDNLITGIVNEQAKLVPGGKVNDKIIAQNVVAKASAAMLDGHPEKIAEIAAAYREFYTTAQKTQWARGPADLGYPRPDRYVVNELGGPAKVDVWSQSQIEAWLVANVKDFKMVPRVEEPFNSANRIR